MNKIIKLLTLILTLLLLPINNSYSMGHKEKRFKFENYKTAEDAKAELLRRHPIGSDVDALLETLRRAGAKVEEKRVVSEYDKQRYLKGIPDYITYDQLYGESSYHYEQPGIRRYILLSYKWGGGISYDKNNKLTHLAVSYWYL